MSSLEKDESISKIEPSRLDYANNAPRIMLESISARMATLIIVLTYSVFIIGFVIDIYTTFQSFRAEDSYLTSNPCYNLNSTSILSGVNTACFENGQWQGTINNLNNVISIQLDLQQNNFTIPIDSSIEPTLLCDINVWACYQPNGCGNNFEGFSNNDWIQVLKQTNLTVDVTFDKEHVVANANIFPNTFQNQESIPSLGLVKSYYISVDYIQDYYEIATTELDNILYTFDVVSRPTQPAKNAVILTILICTLFVFGGYIYVTYTYNKLSNTKWLPEQKWIVVYFIAVILNQNPVTMAIVFSDKSTPISAFSSFVLDQTSQALLFVVWLMFSDSIHRNASEAMNFYLPKCLLGFCILFSGIFVISCQFPTLNPVNGNEINPVEAVVNWSIHRKLAFCIMSIIYISIQWFWTAIWFYNIYKSSQTLNKLPYMSTRYLQLSHRFFTIQAVSVTFYYVFQYISVIVLLSERDTTTDPYSLTNLADNINTLFREQTQLFGKILFLTTYVLILAFLFLPASFGTTSFAQRFTPVPYVITEEERKMESNRRRQINKKAALTNPALFLSSITNNLTSNLLGLKSDVFCVDIALKLRELSYQAYYDPTGLKTESSYDGRMDVESHGYSLVATHYDEQHLGFCYVVREIAPPRRLVVVFRGTASRRQMEDNLNYKRREVSLFSLHLRALDEIDGLTPEHNYDHKALFFSSDISNLLRALQEPIVAHIPQEQGRNASLLSAADHDNASTFGIRFSAGREIDEDYQYSDADYSLHRDSEDRENSTKGWGLRDSIVDGAHAFEKGVSKVANNITDATSKVADVAGVAVAGAASLTPGFKEIVRASVHCGFWEAYETSSRVFVHATLRAELTSEPSDVFFTGHSLGGALASFAAIDFSIHSLPRIKSHLRNNRFGDHENHLPPNKHRKIPRNIKVSMYNFGAPKVGNAAFVQLYDRVVPDSFRIIVDGDLVTGLPPSWNYRHVGTSVVIDGAGAGSMIVDPSFVEQWLRIHTKSSVANHSLLVYRKGLLGVKTAAAYIESLAGAKKYNVRALIRLSNLGNEGIINDQPGTTIKPVSLLVSDESSHAASTFVPFSNTLDDSRLDSNESTHTVSAQSELLRADDEAKHLANDMRNTEALLSSIPSPERHNFNIPRLISGSSRHSSNEFDSESFHGESNGASEYSSSSWFSISKLFGDALSFKNSRSASNAKEEHLEEVTSPLSSPNYPSVASEAKDNALE